MGETWYLACDIQMFIVSPLFIYPLWRSWKIGVSWIISTIIALQIGILAVYIIYDLPATSFATRFKYIIFHFKSYINKILLQILTFNTAAKWLILTTIPFTMFKCGHVSLLT